MQNRKVILRYLIFTSATGALASLVWWLFFTLASPLQFRRLAVVQGLTDQATLTQLATNDPDAWIRCTAVKNLTDQTTLTGFATNNSDADVRRAATENLADQTTLAQIATNDTDYAVRHAAVRKLTNQAILAQIASNDSDDRVRAAAVAKLSDQLALAYVVISAADPAVSHTAFEKVTHEGLSMTLSRTSDLQQRAVLLTLMQFMAAAKEIPAEHRDRLFFEMIPLASLYSEPLWISRFGSLKTIEITWVETSQRYQLPANLTPQEYDLIYWKLKDGLIKRPPNVVGGEHITLTVAFSGTNRFAIVEWKTIFPAELPYGVTWVPGLTDWPAALAWLADHQTTLAEIATNARNPLIGRTAVARMTDQATLAGVASKARDSSVRRAATENLTDQATLTQVAVNDREAFVRRVAVEKLTDQATLAHVAISDGDDEIRRVAVEKLTNQISLAQIVTNDTAYAVRHAAVVKLTDRALLAQIAAKNNDREIRAYAKQRLHELGQ